MKCRRCKEDTVLLKKTWVGKGFSKPVEQRECNNCHRVYWVDWGNRSGELPDRNPATFERAIAELSAV